MKKFLVILILGLLFLAGCEKNLDKPDSLKVADPLEVKKSLDYLGMEGTYESMHKSDQGEIFSTTKIVITNIGKNKYSIKAEYNGVDEEFNFSHEFELLEFSTVDSGPLDKRVSTYIFQGASFKELQSGEGMRQLKIYIPHLKDTHPIKLLPKENITALEINSIHFTPKSETQSNDNIYISFKNATIGGSKKYLIRTFSGYRTN